MKIIKKVGERILPSWLRAELKPILTFTGAGTALIAGSATLASLGWKWLGKRLNFWESIGAILGSAYLAGCGYLQAPQIAHFAIPGAIVAWCVAAWWIAPPAPRAEPAKPSVDTAPELTVTELAAIIRRVAAHRQGAHLADLLAEPEFAGWTQPELKATITGYFGMPVEEFKLILDNRQRVRDGVRVRDLPLAPVPTTPTEAPPGAPGDPAPQPLSATPQGPG